MKNGQHIGFWLTLVCIIFLLGPLMRKGDDMRTFVFYEIAQTRAAFGDSVVDSVLTWANGMYEVSPLARVADTAKGLKHTQKEKDLSKLVAGPLGAASSYALNSYLDGMALAAFVVAIRAAVVGIWIALMAPLLLAAAHDGFCQRKIKLAEFGKLRPATFTMAGMVVIPLICAPIVYLVIPYPLSPMLIPAWACIVAMPISIMVSNMQQLFGR